MCRIHCVVDIVDIVQIQEHSTILKNGLSHIFINACYRQLNILQTMLVYDQRLSDWIPVREHRICHRFRDNGSIRQFHNSLRVSIFEFNSEEIKIVTTYQDWRDVHLLLSRNCLYVLGLSVVCGVNDGIAPIFYFRHLWEYNFRIRPVEF